MLDDSKQAFARAASLIRARLLAGTILQSDETSARVGKWTCYAEDASSIVGCTLLCQLRAHSSSRGAMLYLPFKAVPTPRGDQATVLNFDCAVRWKFFRIGLCERG
jgi:hypothetical protein